MSISTPSCNFVTKILVGFKLDHPVKRRVTRPQCQPVGSSPGFLENQKPEHFRNKNRVNWMAPKIGFYYFRQFADFSFFRIKDFFCFETNLAPKRSSSSSWPGIFSPTSGWCFPLPPASQPRFPPFRPIATKTLFFQNCNSGSIKSDAETDTRAELKNWQQRKNKMVATVASFAEVDFFTSRCTSGRPPARRRRPSWDRFCCPTPWRPCPQPSRNRECQRSVWKKLGENLSRSSSWLLSTHYRTADLFCSCCNHWALPSSWEQSMIRDENKAAFTHTLFATWLRHSKKVYFSLLKWWTPALATFLT